MSSNQCIEYKINGHIGHVILSRQERRNAMNPAFFEEFPLAIKELVKDGQVRAIVISSSGNDFTVGLDLKESILHSPGGSVAKSASIMYERVKALQDSFSVLENTSIPVIAAISGYCIGGGVDLIAACDIRIASADAIFSIREAKIAIVADLGSLQRLPSIIPRGHLYELALTAEDFGADRALEINLINRILPTKEEVIEAAFEVAKKIAANSPLATAGTKNILNSVYGHHLSEDLDRVGLWNSAFLRSNDLNEAIGSFIEKRPPNFTGE